MDYTLIIAYFTVRFPQQFNFPNVTEKNLRSDSLQLLNRPHTS